MTSSRDTVMVGVGASVFFGLVLSGGGADTALFFAPLLVGLGMAYVGSTEVFLQEKTNFVIETLLCSPGPCRVSGSVKRWRRHCSRACSR